MIVGIFLEEALVGPIRLDIGSEYLRVTGDG
jgi:hypothetical protein